jgi:PKD domain
MPLRRLAPIGAAVLALVLAAHAVAATKVSTLVSNPAPTAISGFGSGNSFVWQDWCQIMRVTPSTGSDTATPTVYAGTGCGTEGATRGVFATSTSANSNVMFGPGDAIARAADGNLYVVDSPLGLVHKVTISGGPTVQTIAGTHNGCNVPADNSLAKNADLCDNVWGLAADPSNAGNFVIWDPGDQLTDSTRRVYLVSGTTRDDSVIKTVAGSCNEAAPTANLQLCLPLFGVSVAYLDSDTILIGTGNAIHKVTVSTGAVATVTTSDAVDALTDGFAAGDFFYATKFCQIHHVAGDGTDTIVAGNGTCDPTQRHDGVQATQTAFGDIPGITSYPGGILVLDKSFYFGVPSQVRLVDRTSILSGPPAATNEHDISIQFATLPGDGNNCYLGANIGGEQFFDGCPTPFERTLGDDGYLFEVNGQNGITGDPTPASVGWTIDSVAPSAPVLTSPAADGAVDTASPAFAWEAAADNALPGGTGIERYELTLDGHVDETIAAASCCSTAPSAPLAEGAHSWSLRAFDRAGNSATSTTRSFSYTSAPHAGLTVSPNPALAGATITLNASASSDREGPIASYAFDLDGDGTFEKDNGNSATTTTTFPTAGTFKVGVKVTDGVGQSDQTSTDVKVNAQAIPAGLLGVTINNGAQYTRDPNVELGVKFPSAITAILVSNDGGFLLPQSFPPQQTIKWRLDSSGPERLPKIVYVRFQNGLNVSDNFTDDIILDETPPVVQQASLATPAGAATAAKTRKWTVKVKATDSNSGVQGLQVTENKRKPGKVLAYKRKLSLKGAAKPKFVRARDRAGNLSSWKKLRP